MAKNALKYEQVIEKKRLFHTHTHTQMHHNNYIFYKYIKMFTYRPTHSKRAYFCPAHTYDRSDSHLDEDS